MDFDFDFDFDINIDINIDVDIDVDVGIDGDVIVATREGVLSVCMRSHGCAENNGQGIGCQKR